MAKGTFKRVGGHAVPVGRTARDALFAIADGKTFIADFRTARNPEQHDLFFALCELVAEATDTTKDAVKRWLLVKTNFVDMIFMPDGSMRIDPKSIAWESMEQTEFNSFFQMAVREIAKLLEAAPKEIIQRFEDLLAPDRRAETRKRLKSKVSQRAKETVDG